MKRHADHVDSVGLKQARPDLRCTNLRDWMADDAEHADSAINDRAFAHDVISSMNDAN